MMRYGFTTGSCAAASSKAAAYMLLTGKLKQNITIQTPKGILFQTEILEITRSETEVTCAVRKDGGDDPDITSGTLIFSTVRFADGEKKIPGQNNRQFSGIHVKAMQEKRAVICIDGGKGVGRVTKPGLDQPVGNAAINHVPRRRTFGGADLQSETWDRRGNFHFGNFRDRRTDEQSGAS